MDMTAIESAKKMFNHLTRVNENIKKVLESSQDLTPELKKNARVALGACNELRAILKEAIAANNVMPEQLALIDDEVTTMEKSADKFICGLNVP
jgi:hypothetical protein